MKGYFPVFILGNPRSGTSLLRLMLQQHSDIVAPPESGFAQWWYEKYKNWNADDNVKTKVDEFIKDIASSKKIETWNLDWQLVKSNILDFKPGNYSDLMAIVYLSYGKFNEKVIVDKNNYYIHHLNQLPKIFKNPAFIHLVRDGRDVACSYKDVNDLKTNSAYKPKLTNNIEDIAGEWNANNLRIRHFLHNQQSIIVKYESLIEETNKTLTGICDFLGVAFEHQMVNYYHQSYQEPQSTFDWKKELKEAPLKSKIGRFHHLLSEDEKRIFETVAEEGMKVFGYEQ